MNKYTYRRPLAVRSTQVALAIATVLAGGFGSTAALAQTTAQGVPDAAPAKSAEKLETVQVVGTRKSIESAIERKRRAGTVSDSIVAEDVDQFPDKNVGEALSRVTGVQLSRDFGEGSQVSIRGIEPDLNRIEINGLSVLGTSGTGGRGAELRELASELISSIDVTKGSTADLTEGGIGGTVRITTRKPLDFLKPTAAVTLSGETATSREGVQPRGSLLLADKYLGGRLGLMANFVYDNVLTRNDYARNTSWTFLRDWDFSADKTVPSIDPAVSAVTTPAGCSAATLSAAQKTDCSRQWYDYAPRNSRYGIWTRDHNRSSAELTAQYKFSDDFSAWISHEANVQSQRLNDRNFGTDLVAVTRLNNAGVAPVYNAATALQTKAGTCVAAPTASTPIGMVVQNHTVTEYTVGSCNYLAGVGGQGAFSTQARDFALKIDSKYSSGGFNFKSGDLSVEGLVANSTSNYFSESNSIVLTQNAPGLKVTLDSQSLPHFTFPSGYDPESNSSYVQAQLQYRPSATLNSERQAKLDLKYKIDKGIFDQVWAGVQSREGSSRQYNGGGYLASNGADLVGTADDVNVITANNNQTIVYDPLYTGTAQRAPDTQSFINSNWSTTYVNASQMGQLIQTVRERSPGTFFGGYNGVSNLPANWIAPNYSQSLPYFDTSNFNYGNLYQAKGSDGKVYAQIPTFDIAEKISAAYMRLDFDTTLFGLETTGNIGTRLTLTNVKSSGLLSAKVRVESSPGSATFTDRVVANSIASVDNSYRDVLPSFNAATWLLPNKLVARVGWAKVMSRPALNLLAPNVTCTLGSGKAQFGGDGVDDCTAGNPDLEPYRATKYDLSFEYYPGRDSQLSLALFQNQIDSYILANTRQPNVDFFKDGNLYDVTQPINGRGAVTKGIELTARTAFTFLPGFWSGFGGEVNYTRMTYSYAPGLERLNVLDGSVLPYPGMSPNSYNLALWYDAGSFNGRIAYNYRDAYYTGATDISGNPNFTDKTGYLDAKIQYRYNKNLTLSLEGKNLTDQGQTTYSGELYRVNELAFSGRRYFASASYKF